jgi:N-acetylmuramoyl-L-alanine amidase
MQILHAPSPNFTPSRQGRNIIAIVDHITAGLMPGTLSWLRNPASNVSSHYLVTKAGEVYQLVKDEDTAWHAGIVNRPIWPLYDGTNPNRYTLGIEHEALSGEGLTEAQYQATMKLHRKLTERWGIPVDRNHIIGHNLLDTVNRINDPGQNFPWERLMKDLRYGVIDMVLEKWMIEGGQAALEDLYKKGLIFNPENWSSEEELAKPVPAYLFWIMLNRLQEKIAEKS